MTGLERMREVYEKEREELFRTWLVSRRNNCCPTDFDLPKSDHSCEIECWKCWKRALESEVSE